MTDLPTGYAFQQDADPVAAHNFLVSSYWAKGITLSKVERAFQNSIQISVWFEQAQVKMARVISDYATFAYVNDVYVLEAHRGKGLSKAMLEWLQAHPRLQNIDRWALFTKDAQSLYGQFGWRQYPWPERMMIIDEKVFPQ